MLNALVLKRLPIADPDGLLAASPVTTSAGKALHTRCRAGRRSRARRAASIASARTTAAASCRSRPTARPTLASYAFITGRASTPSASCRASAGAHREDDAPLVDAPAARSSSSAHRFWHRLFNGDPGSHRQDDAVENNEVTIVGVMPRDSSASRSTPASTSSRRSTRSSGAAADAGRWPASARPPAARRHVRAGHRGDRRRGGPRCSSGRCRPMTPTRSEGAASSDSTAAPRAIGTGAVAPPRALFADHSVDPRADRTAAGARVRQSRRACC